VNSSYTGRSTTTRLVAVQRCPAWPKEAATTAFAAAGRSASAQDDGGVLAAEFALEADVAVGEAAADPVADRVGAGEGDAAIRGSSSRASSISAVRPVTTFRTPAGRPASCRARAKCRPESGVSVAGLKHGRVAGREERGELAGRGDQRVVPRG
jgi:hypothetical protein